uniref:Uncharacterized protein n=1 Tax=Glossina brevipalpis TaxID=37001 RepID=A0A1A9WH05_9MUSC
MTINTSESEFFSRKHLENFEEITNLITTVIVVLIVSKFLYMACDINGITTKLSCERCPMPWLLKTPHKDEYDFVNSFVLFVVQKKFFAKIKRMALMDYQAHNFTCYTVPECSADEDDANHYSSQLTLKSSHSSTSSSIDRNILRKHCQTIKYHKKFFDTHHLNVQERLSTPPVLKKCGTNSLQFGYFVPFTATNCYFSPPVQRRRYREKENERNRRAVSYGGITTNNARSDTTLPRAAPRRVNLMKEPPPPPPPKPPLLLQQQQSSSPVLVPSNVNNTNNSSSLSIPSKYPQSEYNLIQKLDSNTTLTAPAQYQPQNFYVNASSLSNNATGSNYGSLLCHTSSSTTSPLAVRKREKLLHRFSDAATLGRKLKKKKNNNRTCRSMTEAIEMLADPVIEDEFFFCLYTSYVHSVDKFTLDC